MQTDRLMVPFLEECVSDIVLMLMKMIVKHGILMKANTNFKFIKIDLSNFDNLPCELIKLPTATNALMKVELPNQKKCNFLIVRQKMWLYCRKSKREIPFNIWQYLLCRFIVSFTNYCLQRKVQWLLLQTY